MEVIDKQYDNVIDGVVAIGFSTYNETIEKLVPLIDKTEFQRRLQDKRFYKKLERDLENGCVIPPITVAFITSEISNNSEEEAISDYINSNIKKSFVLDGIQRLNTLSRLKNSKKISQDRKIYINFIFCNSIEKLLYRMITLNNGQRPMTPRHQVEMMMSNTLNFEDIGLEVVSEKDSSPKSSRNAFRKADIIQAYLAFMADSPIVDNKKIIEEKMDDLLVGKIMSIEPNQYKSSFKDFLTVTAKFKNNSNAFKWLKIANNLIGFAAGFKHSFDQISQLSADEFSELINTFDDAFSDFNPSRIKVGKYRRELSCEFFKNLNEYKDLSSDELLEAFSEITTND